MARAFGGRRMDGVDPGEIPGELRGGETERGGGVRRG